MYFISTRNKDLRKTLVEAMRSGLADDGGLFVPEYLPRVNLKEFTPDLTYAVFAQKLLHYFFSEDALDKQLLEICEQAFNFPIPLKQINPHTFMLELFHGPTLSFKDLGARFLAECMSRISAEEKLTIMVATSGDTGSAVASAFYLKPNIQVIILYPKGKISSRQEHQIACWDNNVTALAVLGTFDDCQRLVKEASHAMHLSSANSINIGRLLPQVVYYAYASVQFFHQYGVMPGFVVPSGNLGNVTACYWAQVMGFPIREVVLSTNANTTVTDYLKTGEFKPHRSVATLANAMDVGNPSNFERLQHLFNTFEVFKKNVRAMSANDEAIKQAIKDFYQQYKIIICPHTATAAFVREQLSDQPWIIVATADPCKFDNVIEPVIQHKVPIAPPLQQLLDKPIHIREIPPSLDAVKKFLIP